jgi:hypothetical protein
MKISKTRVFIAVFGLFVGALIVDHFLGPSAQQRKLYEPVSKYEAPSVSSVADYTQAQSVAKQINCSPYRFVAIPTTGDIQVVGIQSGRILQVAGQVASYKHDVIGTTAQGFDPKLGCKVFQLGAKAVVYPGVWKNTGTSSVVISNNFAIPKRIVAPNQSTTITDGETGQFIY